MADNELTIVIRAKNLLRQGLSRAGSLLDKFKGRVASAGKAIASGFRKARFALAALVAGFVAAIKHAEDFRAQMAQVSVMLGDNQKMLAGMREGIIRMSAEFGESKETLSKGLYDILSAGIDAAGAMDVLRVAMKAAVGGGTDVATSVDAITTVMNAYGLKAKDATHISDVLFQVVKDGKVTYAELAENIGKLAPTARAAGLTLEQMGATIAALVKVEKPERAMTALSAALTEAARRGMTLFELVERYKGKGLETIVGEGVTRRAATGIAILANNFGVLQQEIQKFGDVTGAAEEAFQRVEDTRLLGKIFQSALAAVTKFAEAIGAKLRPELQSIADTIKRLIEEGQIDVWAGKAAATFQALIPLAKSLAKWVGNLGKGFIALATFASGAASAQGGVIAKFKAGKKAIDDLVEAQFQARVQARAAAEERADKEKPISEEEKKKAAFLAKWAEVERMQAMFEERAARKKEERQKTLNKLKEKEAEIIAKIADKEKQLMAVKKQQDVVKGIQKQIDDLDKAAAKREEIAKMLIPEFIAKQKQDQQQEKQKLEEDKKIAKLRAKEERGIKLSKKDKELLNAADAREVIRRQAVLDRDKQRKLQDRLKKEQEKLNKLQRSNNEQLKAIRKKIEAVLQMK